MEERWFDGLIHLGPTALVGDSGHITYVSVLYLGTTYPSTEGTTKEWADELEAALEDLAPGEFGLIPMPEMLAFADLFVEFTSTVGLMLYIYIGGPPWDREAAVCRGKFDGPGWQNKPEMMAMFRHLRHLVDFKIDETLGRHEHF